MDEAGIQITFLGVKELRVETFWPIVSDAEFTPEQGVMQQAIGQFDPKTRKIQIKIRFFTGSPKTPSPEEVSRMQAEKKQPFYLSAEIVGEFHLDPDTVPESDIPKWAQSSAAPILVPFLREQVYSLSLRIGVQPIFLPLVISNPYIRMEAPKEQEADMEPVSP